LVESLKKKFGRSFNLSICPLEAENDTHAYTEGIEQSLNTDLALNFLTVSRQINTNSNIDLVVVQHEFGLFKNNEKAFLEFLEFLNKPVLITFHTVLPKPDNEFRLHVKQISSFCDEIIVMTRTSRDILVREYDLVAEKITVIPHGTHLVSYASKALLKKNYGLAGKKVLSTFGLLGHGKSIETTLEALPGIIEKYPKVIFLIIGRTHPTLVKQEGEKYRDFLIDKVADLGIGKHVRFVNQFVPLENLLEYLQLTDIYLFTSKDPHQAVSGTFAYAMSCGCPIISTPIPHALEALQNKAGLVVDFRAPKQFEKAVTKLLGKEKLRKSMKLNGLHTTAASAWENTAMAHARIFRRFAPHRIQLRYAKPPVKLDHIKKMTTRVGIIQFSKINQPDLASGYTLDDNARALILLCQHYELSGDPGDLKYIKIYFNFIYRCFRPDGRFLNYLDEHCRFTDQNDIINLEDAQGRAVWALGYLLSMSSQLPTEYHSIEDKAIFVLRETLKEAHRIYSPRALAFILKGIYYYHLNSRTGKIKELTTVLADRLMKIYQNESTDDWQWYEGYLTYGNSVIPHAMLLAYAITGNPNYKEIAKASFDFLLSRIFVNNSIRVISNKNWLQRGQKTDLEFKGGEQPVDVGYTILALRKFDELFPDQGYDLKMEAAFNWFLGDNPLQQIIYNPCTGGCYDGLELHNVNLNQGAESTIIYLLSRLVFEGLPNK
jgi:glycosyltransferase involved in cell wall biosynthesis